MKQTQVTFNPTYIDTSIRPQDDFYAYACGGWSKKNPVPAEESRWGTFDMLRKNSQVQLKGVVEEAVREKKVLPGSPSQLVRDFWLSGMDVKTRNSLGVSPIQGILKEIQEIQDSTTLARFLADAHLRGIDIFWRPSVEPDEKNSAKNVLYFHQSGLTLPDRDFYLEEDSHFQRIRAELYTYVTTLSVAVGVPRTQAKKMSEVVSRIETILARASMTGSERRDIEKCYNKRTMQKLRKEYQTIDWNAYFGQLGLKGTNEFIVSQPNFIAAIDTLIAKASLDEIKAYLLWRAIDELAIFLDEKTFRRFFKFHGIVLSGAKKPRDLWRRVIQVVDSSVGDALGQLYVRKYFDATARRKINTLVDHVFTAYANRIKRLDWMTAPTKKKALIKLAAMNRKLGHPQKWEHYRGLEIHSEDYFGNVLRARIHEARREIKKVGKKPDSKQWLMTASTVNAYFWPNLNEIVFPAAIMQPPFFDVKADDALNYGAIGTVIAHEITHGFDDNGSKYDAKGNLKEWWTKKDRMQFQAKATAMVKQFNDFVAIDEMHVNGQLTLGENIADLGGIAIALEAFRQSDGYKKGKMIDGFTPLQRFFFGCVMVEAEQIRPEMLKQKIVTDTHSPGKFRINGPLANTSEFMEAFDVMEGDLLYRAPKDRISIW